MSDNSAMSHGIQVVLTILIIGGLTSGCRSYGGYDSEAATYAQMQEAHRVFQEELARAKGDLERLQAAAGEQDVLNRMATQYAYVVQGHETILEDHADHIEELSAGSDYRDLRRAFGAIISEQRTIRLQYEGVLRNLYRAYTPADTTAEVERPYALIPPFYERIRHDQHGLTVNEVLSQVRSGSSPADGFMRPDDARTSSEADSVQGTGAMRSDLDASDVDASESGH